MTRTGRDGLTARLADIEAAYGVGVHRDVAGLITVLSAQNAGREVSTIPGRSGHVSIDGEVYLLSDHAREVLLTGGGAGR